MYEIKDKTCYSGLSVPVNCVPLFASFVHEDQKSSCFQQQLKLYPFCVWTELFKRQVPILVPVSLLSVQASSLVSESKALHY